MKKKISKESLAAIIFLTPSFLGFLIFFLFPVLFSLILSFAKWDMSSGISNIQFIGLHNFKSIFKDIWFKDSMKNSLIFTVSTVAIGVSISLVLAVILTRAAFFKQTLKAMMFLPYISSTVAIAIVWMIMLQPKFGPVNQFLLSIGVDKPPYWLADMKWAMPALSAMYIWQNLGYNMVVYIAGLSGVPVDLYEAAEIDGAGALSKFRYVTIPMVSPTTFFLVIMGIINSFKVFDQVNVLTQGGPGTSTTVLSLYIYREAFKFYDMGSASSAAWIMFVIIFAVTIIQWIGQKKWVTYE